MSSCSIQLDNYQGHYYPGSVIAGRVICVFNKSKNIRGIKVKLLGAEHNDWTETETYYDDHDKTERTRTVYYSGNNTFLHSEVSLIGEGEVGPGKFEYSFAFQLPNNIPATYRGPYGGISFSVDAKVDRPFKFDYEDSRQVVVASPIDFNQMKDQLQLDPVSLSDDKTLCCWCCASDPITMEVNLEKEAFVVGEVVNVKVNITNLSNTSIEALRAKLGMKVTSMVTTPSNDSKSDYELLATANETGVGAHGERTYNLTLEIPQSAQIPNFNLCQLFKQKTKLKVEAVLPGCHNNMEIETDVTMGHIPIYDPSQIPGQYPPNTYLPNTYPANTYPPNTYPANAYPSNTIPNPYPPNAAAPPYSPMKDPIAGPIGFTVPKEEAAGPSAPPAEGGASAPSKKEMAENEFVMIGSDIPASSELPPPSYHEIMTHPTKK